MTALLDAYAHRMGAVASLPQEELDPVTLGLLGAARRIDGERRTRG